ncbi:cytidine deaminase [Leisingera sp. McT4-56]|uniref:cytidine deaminase n=1 Tax=Leisingera sp. McT4-56 TaxID=2881255 RepID=UPI001CF8A2E4|nr:cytidine deaminase [Leisingera sp. McT4-56]MCB4455397.1 cytidine deaminase [Leisingera sp. McT4-56]
MHPGASASRSNSAILRHLDQMIKNRGIAMSLKAAAAAVRENAHAPYSNFKVGAAVRSASGQIYVGCNVENVAYPEGTCAEAGAIASMVAAGEKNLAEVYVIADCPTPITPCGGCRQKIKEFASGDVKVIMATTDGEEQETTIGALLPGAFDADHMERS